nr:uncharacterized protein LOC123572409 isoform X1 [Macaca fascicularis]
MRRGVGHSSPGAVGDHDAGRRGANPRGPQGGGLEIPNLSTGLVSRFCKAGWTWRNVTLRLSNDSHLAVASVRCSGHPWWGGVGRGGAQRKRTPSRGDAWRAQGRAREGSWGRRWGPGRQEGRTSRVLRTLREGRRRRRRSPGERKGTGGDSGNCCREAAFSLQSAGHALRSHVPAMPRYLCSSRLAAPERCQPRAPATPDSGTGRSRSGCAPQAASRTEAAGGGQNRPWPGGGPRTALGELFGSPAGFLLAGGIAPRREETSLVLSASKIDYEAGRGGSHLLSQHSGRPRQMDHLRSGVQDPA